MTPAPNEITLEIKPQKRFDVIDIRKMIIEQVGDFMERYKKSYYCSYHTTAGYFEQSLSSRLQRNGEHVAPFIGTFQKFFPSDANYRHDQLQLRTELSDAEKQCEPRNADSHLIFMSSGLKNCVKYDNEQATPAYFVDLDGVNDGEHRNRRTTVLGFDEEKTIFRDQIAVQVSRHPIDSINLKNTHSGFIEELNDLLGKLAIRKGRVDITLSHKERNAALTVNEYETLLMRHDLAEVLHDPLRFMALQGKHMLLDPGAIPNKTINYAKYDLVHVFNELMDALKMSESVIEKILSAFLRVPASRFFRMKKKVSLLVSDIHNPGHGQIILGKYQSPILVQWSSPQSQTRHLDVRIKRFQ